PFHTPALATVAEDGTPAVRTVVLRGFDAEHRYLRIHTDVRSAKVAEMTAHPAVMLHAYDPGQQVQVRLTGRARIHTGDGIARQFWLASQPKSRLCYAVSPGPGQPVEEPPPAPLQEDGAEANFAVFIIQFDALEWLLLASAGHRRARFTWREGELASTWLVP
ncbi:MAG: pyridoxamine 5'-phosphate oxidase family protein, partial [Rhodospirillales bacterium]|nr:pyridoxamine 5'-phosphate oxidase family protein [Acetobacter sp.]